MGRKTKRQYRIIRKEFKTEVRKRMETNHAYAMMVVQTFSSWHYKKHITAIWGMFQNPDYRRFEKAYSETLKGKVLSGKEGIWQTLSVVDRKLHDAFNKKIPVKYAMGDALAVAYQVLKEPEKHKYLVVFRNRFANETQTERIIATNAFRAGRAFYRKRNRKAYYDCLIAISKI